MRDLAAHLGPWLAGAEIQLERIQAGTYEGHGVDVNALNAPRSGPNSGPAA